MENIIEPNEHFDFSKLTLAHPSGIQGGSYFTKIEHNNKPLYIQTTKSLTRQGIVKTGKKYYCDLMFDNNSVSLINWFENLEETCQKLIYSKSESWFQNVLEINDIEHAFSSILRVYRSGKYYLVRTNIKNSPITNEPSVKIYNENEVSLTMNDVTNETNIISILEIQGIKFSTRNFQIEIELKQIMVLNNEILFENCLIKTNKSETEKKQKNTQSIQNAQNNQVIQNTQLLEHLEITDNEFANEKNENTNNIIQETKEIGESESLDNLEECILEQTDIKESNENIDLLLEIEELEPENNKDLTEVELNDTLESNLETITLKKPNQVYFELYKEARQKAKAAKKMAILAYLEAKNIKKSYMIENLNESDSDFDAEIDEVSESELEGL